MASPLDYALTGVKRVDQRARLDSAIKLRDKSSLDPYVFQREAYLQRRRHLIYDGNPPLDSRAHSRASRSSSRAPRGAAPLHGPHATMRVPTGIVAARCFLLLAIHPWRSVIVAQYIYTMNRVTKVVPPKREILKDISLSFFPGAKIGVLGLNGCGQVHACCASWRASTPTFTARRGRRPASASATCPRSRSWTRTRTCAATSRTASREVKDLLTRFDEVSAKFAEPMDDDEMNALLEEQGKLQDAIDAADAWELDRRLEMATDALRLPPGDADVEHAVRRRAASRGAVPAAAVGAGHAAAGRAHQPPGRGVRGLAGALPGRVPGHRRGGHPRPLLPGQRGRLDPGAGPRPRHSLEGQLLLLAGAEGASAWPRKSARTRRASASSRASWSGCAATPRAARPRARRA